MTAIKETPKEEKTQIKKSNIPSIRGFKAEKQKAILEEEISKREAEIEKYEMKNDELRIEINGLEKKLVEVNKKVLKKSFYSIVGQVPIEEVENWIKEAKEKLQQEKN